MPEFFEITVITTGEDLEDRFNGSQPLKVVFNRALAEVGGGAERDNFTLEFNDQELDVDTKISDAAERLGWGEEIVLELVPRPVVI